MEIKLENKICCLCGKKFDGEGNSPWPFEAGPNDNLMCCDHCYEHDVRPAVKAMTKLFKSY